MKGLTTSCDIWSSAAASSDFLLAPPVGQKFATLDIIITTLLFYDTT